MITSLLSDRDKGKLFLLANEDLAVIYNLFIMPDQASEKEQLKKVINILTKRNRKRNIQTHVRLRQRSMLMKLRRAYKAL